MSLQDTIAALATAPGPSGVAVVRVSGPEAFSIAERLTGAKVRPGRITLRTLKVEETRLDEAIVLAFRGPKSYTGEDVVEFQGHGGSVTPRRVLEACFAAGARLAHRGEFTERAFLNGRIDYNQAESVLNLIEAKTERAADEALSGLAGEQTVRLRSLYEALLTLSSQLEHALDVDETELSDKFKIDVKSSLSAIKGRLSDEINRLKRARVLKDGACVVLAGPPNAGKSSLLNALLGENRAIVSEIPGTTRDSIEVWTDFGGFPVRLMDTAGLRVTGDIIEAEGVRRAEELIRAADLVIAFDGADGITEEKTLPIHAKCDLARCEARLNVSVRTGEGLSELRDEIVRRLELLEPREEPRDIETLLTAMRFLREVPAEDPVLLANAVRNAAQVLGEALGAEYSSDLLDRLFSRFCVGK